VSHDGFSSQLTFSKICCPCISGNDCKEFPFFPTASYVESWRSATSTRTFSLSLGPLSFFFFPLGENEKAPLFPKSSLVRAGSFFVLRGGSLSSPPPLELFFMRIIEDEMVPLSRGLLSSWSRPIRARNNPPGFTRSSKLKVLSLRPVPGEEFPLQILCSSRKVT